MKIYITAEYCKGCGICMHFCPKDALKWSEERNGYGVHTPVVEEDKCISCGTCAVMCPDAVIELKEA